MVVRYSIGWSGRVARGREVMGLSVGGLGRAGEVSKGERAAAAAVRACMLVGVLSDIRRVRLGKAGFRFGGAEVRRMSRI